MDAGKRPDPCESPSSVKHGDLVVYSFFPIGIVTSDSDNKGNFSTIEANTGSAGERAGDGVYRKTRNLSPVGSAIACEEFYSFF